VTCASTTQFIISRELADESLLNEKILIAFLSILLKFQQAQRDTTTQCYEAVVPTAV
jgi:hypothetical protein